ncbi:Phosphoglycolate phosphatase [bacterium HR36]|nr:Phosphoglycolate phosphatase [bacterium HR36]
MPPPVQVIFLDAVGTLIQAQPSVPEVYQRIGRLYGCSLELEEIERRFRAAFRRQQEVDRRFAWRTDEDRERQRWQAIVREVFVELADTQELFRTLWQHFARADSWTCYPEVADSLARLDALGFQVGIASNFDQRLRCVCQGLPALRPCRWLMISSELGWLKPSRAFFQTIAERLSVAPGRIVYVGDDYETDCLAAQQAGWHAVWICRHLAVVPTATYPHVRLPSQAEPSTPTERKAIKPQRPAESHRLADSEATMASEQTGYHALDQNRRRAGESEVAPTAEPMITRTAECPVIASLDALVPLLDTLA